MADLTISISNSIRAFGNGPSTKWNLFSWGLANWGEGTTDLQTDVGKVLSNSLSLSDSLTLVADFAISVSNQFTNSFEGSEQTLTDQAGYYHVFTGGVTDADERASATYTQGSAGSTSWSQSSTVSTSWS